MNPQFVFILGRQPALGLAELESLYGPNNLQPVGTQAALLQAQHTIDFSRLGGSTRQCDFIATVQSTQWETVINHIEPRLLGLATNLPKGKIRLGLSYLGQGVNAKLINATGLSLKKTIKGTERSIRLVPNTAPELNTAQVLHNQLTGPTGIELVFIPHKNQTVVARTTHVQDINAYAARDQKRPRRDARVGMLPPKLAQIIINLSGKHAIPSAAVTGQKPHQARLLDPFCGTGVVLQEAALAGYSVYGTDLDERMVRYTRDNLNWLKDSRQIHFEWFLETADATSHQWQQPFDMIACETYLGRPLNALPAPDAIHKIIADCDTIHRKFLENVARQTTSGFRLCIGVPAWKTKNGFKHLPTLDNLHELGYNRLRFVHASNEELIYHRPDQIVGRELVILTRM
jgi:SAM-dependent methyltransferase